MSKPIAQTAQPDATEIEAAHAAARQLAQELTQIDGRINATAVEAGRTADEGRARELLAERDALVQRKEVLPFLLRGARARFLQATAADIKAQAAPVAAALAEAQAEVSVATAEFDAAAAALERAAARLKTAERQREEFIALHGRLLGEVGEIEIDAYRVAHGIDLLRPDRFDGPM
jgi:chromosome segregation ATPase